MTLSKEYAPEIIRHEIEQTREEWAKFDPEWVCYANVADYYMREKGKALGNDFTPKIAGIIAGEIAWWVQETLVMGHNKR